MPWWGLRPIAQMIGSAAWAGQAGLMDRRHMNRQTPVTGFSASERDYIRRELDMFFSTLPTVAEGFQLKTWRGGPQAGQPKFSPAAKSLLERWLMRLDATSRPARLFFTNDVLDALRMMM